MMQVGEDSVSYERHIKQLQAEFSKTRRNPQVVAELMTKTFPMRRAEILQQTCDVTKIFERFPFLQDVEYVSALAIRNCSKIILILFVCSLSKNWSQFWRMKMEVQSLESVGIRHPVAF